jgi:alginate O-acetyltransferase complex protein AlgI
MLFNSGIFLFFYLFLYLGFVLCKKTNIQNLILLLGSYTYYCWWDYRFLSLILISTFVDFWVSKNLQAIHDKKKTGNKKIWLTISLIVNFGLLAFFKYFNFLAENIFSILDLLGVQDKPWSLNIILPLGISFYTFQTVSYTVDVYRKRFKAIDNYLDFSLFVSFFPQLIAGPIERASSLLPQLQKKKKYQRK